MIVSIHQPDFLPYIGFFYKIRESDKFVLLDNVQFEKNSYTNRNMIKGGQWLTVPVLTKGKEKPLINEILINNKTKWRRKHLNAIKLNYSKAKNYNKYISFIEGTYEYQWEKLIDLNVHLIRWVLKELNIKTNIILASELGIKEKKSKLITKICEKLRANTYISGKFGRDYLNMDDFKGIKVKFLDAKPTLSIIDLMMRGEVNESFNNCSTS